MPGLLALLAHPDDEIFCAGLLAAVAGRGVPVHLVYWTRGEGGGSFRRRALWRCLPRAWHPRAGEARRSAAVLGAASLTFLGAIDPVAEGGLRAPVEDKTLMPRLAALLEQHRPEMVLTHGSEGDYGHPAHQRLHQIAREAVAQGGGYPLLSFNATWPGAPDARFLNRSDSADFIFDAQPFFRKKLAVMRAHRSQKGTLAAVAPGASFRDLLRLGRYEGYHCWAEGERRTEALAKLRQWTAPGAV